MSFVSFVVYRDLGIENYSNHFCVQRSQTLMKLFEMKKSPLNVKGTLMSLTDFIVILD